MFHLESNMICKEIEGFFSEINRGNILRLELNRGTATDRWHCTDLCTQAIAWSTVCTRHACMQALHVRQADPVADGRIWAAYAGPAAEGATSRGPWSPGGGGLPPSPGAAASSSSRSSPSTWTTSLLPPSAGSGTDGFIYTCGGPSIAHSEPPCSPPFCTLGLLA
jgi:hypothetical protein